MMEPRRYLLSNSGALTYCQRCFLTSRHASISACNLYLYFASCNITTRVSKRMSYEIAWKWILSTQASLKRSAREVERFPSNGIIFCTEALSRDFLRQQKGKQEEEVRRETVLMLDSASNRGLLMRKLATYEGIIENGRVKSPPDAGIPDKTRVYVVVPDQECHLNAICR